MYYLRTDAGILVGKIDNKASGIMMNQMPGRWQEKNFVNGKKIVYVFTQAASFGNDIMKFQVWEGFYLEEV